MSEERKLMVGDDLISVTMSRSAAITASAALLRAHVRMTPDSMWPPESEKDRKDFETAEWLRWLISRIEIGSRVRSEFAKEKDRDA